MSTSIMMWTVNLRDLLRNQFGCSPLACGAFSSETPLFLFTFLHSYFMLKSNIFLQKRHNKLTLTSVMRIWRVDTIIAGGWIGGIKGMSPGSVPLPPSPIHCSAPFTCRNFPFWPHFFPFSFTAEPGLMLLVPLMVKVLGIYRKTKNELHTS